MPTPKPRKKAAAPRKKTAAAPKKTAKKKNPAAARKAKAPVAKKAVKKKGKVPFKRTIKKQLLATKGRILQEVAHKVEDESRGMKTDIGDIYDIASSERERELSLMLGDRGRAQLSEIEDALERLDLKSYGTCGECGEPIAEQRLMALPFTRVCVECKSKEERERLIRGRPSEETGLGVMDRSESEEDEF
ncbi:MAG: TraR/DksA family transcriptional regulator [Thermodesulfobacteriota bacterium]